jgi:hypothetical protein
MEPRGFSASRPTAAALAFRIVTILGVAMAAIASARF